jgi:hypothetical protein
MRARSGAPSASREDPAPHEHLLIARVVVARGRTRFARMHQAIFAALRGGVAANYAV